MESKFKIGDCVELKTGSPKMTIQEILTETTERIPEERKEFKGNVKCVFFNEVTKEFNRESFHQDSLLLCK